MIGMPFNSSSPIVYFNVQAIEKAGVSAPKTWEEFQSVTAPALKSAGYTALSQSHLPWVFTENFMSRHDLPFATNNNGYDGAEGTKILVISSRSKTTSRLSSTGKKKPILSGSAPVGATIKPRLKTAKLRSG